MHRPGKWVVTPMRATQVVLRSRSDGSGEAPTALPEARRVDRRPTSSARTVGAFGGHDPRLAGSGSGVLPHDRAGREQLLLRRQYGGGRAGSAPQAPEAVDPPCCDALGNEALPVASTQAIDKTPLAAATSAVAIAVRLPTLRFAVHRVIVFVEHARAPVLARGSPPRRGKLRARLGVTTC